MCPNRAIKLFNAVHITISNIRVLFSILPITRSITRIPNNTNRTHTKIIGKKLAFKSFGNIKFSHILYLVLSISFWIMLRGWKRFCTSLQTTFSKRTSGFTFFGFSFVFVSSVFSFDNIVALLSCQLRVLCFFLVSFKLFFDWYIIENNQNCLYQKVDTKMLLCWLDFSDKVIFYQINWIGKFALFIYCRCVIRSQVQFSLMLIFML